MAYQNIGTPRFFIDWNSYAIANGLMVSDWFYRTMESTRRGTVKPYMNLNPGASPTCTRTGDVYMGMVGEFDGIPFDANTADWMGLLGHDMQGVGLKMSIGSVPKENDFGQGAFYNYLDVTSQNWGPINGTLSGGFSLVPNTNGFSMCELSGSTETNLTDSKLYKTHMLAYSGLNVPHKFGTFAWGNTYTMKQSPDMDLSMTIDMDGSTQYNTKGGATLSNQFNDGAPAWNDLEAWECQDKNNFIQKSRKIKRKGRRTWTLKFSFLSDDNLFTKVSSPTNTGSENYNAEDFTSDSLSGYNDDFISMVWNRTNGGHLPFIFQPDSSNESTDSFALCRFDMNSLKITQSMHRKYTIQLKIRESW